VCGGKGDEGGSKGGRDKIRSKAGAAQDFPNLHAVATDSITPSAAYMMSINQWVVGRGERKKGTRGKE
jgi:hypothetical protein